MASRAGPRMAPASGSGPGVAPASAGSAVTTAATFPSVFYDFVVVFPFAIICNSLDDFTSVANRPCLEMVNWECNAPSRYMFPPIHEFGTLTNCNW